MNPKLVVRYAIRECLGIVGMAVALFWSAGTIGWWPAWAALAVMTGWILATAIVIVTSNPHLLAERLGPRKGAKRWDTALMSLVGLLQLARYIVAGLDHRNGWTGSIPLAAQVVALAVCVLGYALFVWATASNKFFSQIVRIQTERSHTVATGGPYRFLRHPGYAGGLLFELAVGVLLASWGVAAISVFTAFLLVLRTALEDRTLLAELSGYVEYARQVRYRLLPFLW